MTKTPDRIIAFSPRFDARYRREHPNPTDECACGLVRLGDLAVRRVGSVTHGIIACIRHEQTQGGV
jgi:hypothetical protein